MKDLFSKVMVVLVGVAAFLGISAANVTASAPSTVSEITGKSALYLEHGKSIAVDMTISNGFNDHYSHSSHESHESHSSHRSHYSGY
jgi:hypothetical protein